MYLHTKRESFFLNCSRFSSVEFLLDAESSFSGPVGGKSAQTKDDKELQLYPEPSLDKFFNVIVVTAPSPSNFFVGFSYILCFM